ncbi:MAG: hypothetical protein AMXMBFR13_23760 [Phycisphaerae bacterium]
MWHAHGILVAMGYDRRKMRSMKRKDKARKTQHTSSKRKISETIWEFVGDFIREGETLSERQVRLTIACIAWSIACQQKPEERQKMLDEFMARSLQPNSRVTLAELAAIRRDIEKLVSRKRHLFLTDLRLILDARLVPVPGGERIEAMSATLG